MGDLSVHKLDICSASREQIMGTIVSFIESIILKCNWKILTVHVGLFVGFEDGTTLGASLGQRKAHH